MLRYPTVSSKSLQHFACKAGVRKDRATRIGQLDWELDVVVSHIEEDSPPEVKVTADGTRDYALQAAYLRAKLPGFQNEAHETANRILLFFRFFLFTPLVRPIEAWSHSLQNPKWFAPDGIELKGGTIFMLPPVPGLRGELGAKKLSPAELPTLESFVTSPLTFRSR